MTALRAWASRLAASMRRPEDCLPTAYLRPGELSRLTTSRCRDLGALGTCSIDGLSLDDPLHQRRRWPQARRRRGPRVTSNT